MPRAYIIELAWSPEDGFVGTVPDLPGCSFVGDTQEAALAEASPAIAAWIEAAKKAGNTIPEPRLKPASEE